MAEEATPVADAMDSLKAAGMKIDTKMSPDGGIVFVVYVPLGEIER